VAGFSLFAQSPTAIATAWRDITQLIVGGSVKPMVERVYPLDEAGGALRHLIEDRPMAKSSWRSDVQRPCSLQKPNLRTTEAGP
jgi:hypothetical protein